MKRFYINLLGEFQLKIVGEGNKVEGIRPVDSDEARALIAFLAYHSVCNPTRRSSFPNSHRRDVLASMFADMFAPDCKTDTDKRGWFRRKPVLEARKALTFGEEECEVLPRFTGTTDLCLNPDAFHLDVQWFHIYKNSYDIKELEELHRLYRGDLLKGQNEPWIEEERKDLRTDFIASMATLTNLYYERNEVSKAIRFAQELSSKYPVEPMLHKLLMNLYKKVNQNSHMEEQYERCKHEFSGRGIALPSDIESLYEQLQTKSPRAVHSISSAPPKLSEAHRMIAEELFEQGRQLCNERTEAKLRTSTECFLHALQHNPNHSRATAALADAHSLLGYYIFVTPEQAYNNACKYLSNIPERDAEIPEVLTARAWIATIYDRQWILAEELFRRAKQVMDKSTEAANPSTHQWYSFLLMILGREEESQYEIGRADILSQRGLKSPVISKSIGQRYYYAGRYQEAVTHFETSLKMYPRRCLTLYCLAQAYEQLALEAREKEDEKEAERLFSQSVDKFNEALRDPRLVNYPSIMAGLGHVYALFKPEEESNAILQQLAERQEDENYVSPVALATVYVGRNNFDEAIKQLEEALKQKPGDLVLVGIDPRFKALRSHQRFASIWNKIDVKQASKLTKQMLTVSE